MRGAFLDGQAGARAAGDADLLSSTLQKERRMRGASEQNLEKRDLREEQAVRRNTADWLMTGWGAHPSDFDGNGVTGNGLPPNPSPLFQKKIILEFFKAWLLVPDNPLPVTPLPLFQNLGLSMRG